MPDKSWLFLAAMLFLVVGLSLYSRVILYGPFIFDDAAYVTGNPASTSLTAALDLTDSRQVGYASFAINYALSGENPPGYHLVNVVIHICNSFLVFVLVFMFFRMLGKGAELPLWSVYASLLSGLIFLVHPLQTQAVSYITQRFTSLATLLYLLSVLLYIFARDRFETRESSGISYACLVISLIMTIAAMKTKEIAFTIPAILFFIEWFVFSNSRFGRKRLIFLIPFLCTLAIIPLAILGPEWGIIGADDGMADIIRTDKIYDLTQRSPLQYFFTQIRAIMVYIKLYILPVGQQAIYDFPVSKSFFETGVVFSFLFLAALAAGAVYLWKKYKSYEGASDSALVCGMASIGIVWFFVGLSVESSFFPIKDVIFEHRAYLPSVGFFSAAAALIMYGAGRFMRTFLSTKMVAILFLIIALPLSAATVIRNEVWTDDFRFWNDVVEKCPDKAIGYNNRASARARLEDYEGALEDYSRAISFFPKNTEELFRWENSDFSSWNMSRTYTARGNVYVALGQNDRAREDFMRSKEIFSMPVDADNLLVEADSFAKRLNYIRAVELYNLILDWDPEHTRALNDRANAYSYLKRFPDAVNDLTRVISLEPDYVLAYHNRGIAYAWSGKSEQAVSDLKKACQMGFEPSCKGIDIVRSGNR